MKKEMDALLAYTDGMIHPFCVYICFVLGGLKLVLCSSFEYAFLIDAWCRMSITK